MSERTYVVGDRVEFADPDKGPIRGTVRYVGDFGYYKVLFDHPIFNGAVIETVNVTQLRPLSILELMAEAAQ